MSVADNSTEIIICTEQGKLESMTKVLVSSLRNFGGRASNWPIYSYAPRSGKKPSRDTIDFFEENEVHYIDEDLNTSFHDYVFYNKAAACLHRVENSTAKSFLFLDSDTFFLKEPAFFIDFIEPGVAARPVDFRNIGTSGKENDTEYPYWSKLMELLNIESWKKERTTFENELILAYYNGGIILNSRHPNLFREYAKNLEIVLRSGIQPSVGNFYIEQSVLSATIIKSGAEIKLMPKEYNVPVNNFRAVKNPDYRIDDFSSIVLAHYHRVFQSQERAARLIGQLKQLDHGPQLISILKQYNMIKKQPTTLNKIKRKLKRVWSTGKI